jgi:L-type amino acid transporter 9
LQANYAASELQNPSTQLPLAINTAVPLVTACYVLTNAAYYILVPWTVVGTTDAIAVTAMSRLLGKPAALGVALLIVAVILGALSGNIFVAGRLTVAAANKGYLPSFLGYVGHIRQRPTTTTTSPSLRQATTTASSNTPSPEDNATTEPKSQLFEAPLNAYILLCLLTSAYILATPGLRFLLTYDGLVEYTFFFLTVLGDLILRFREKELERPYKPSIVLPGIFVLVSGAVVVRGAVFEWGKALIGVGVLAVGALGYTVVRWMARKKRDA